MTSYALWREEEPAGRPRLLGLYADAAAAIAAAGCDAAMRGTALGAWPAIARGPAGPDGAGEPERTAARTIEGRFRYSLL